MYNNFSSKKTKKVISALLASALVVTSAPVSAEAATTKVLGVNKTFTKTATKVSGLSKSEKKIVKVTVNKSKKKVTVKGLKPGKASFKIGSKSYTVKVGAVAIKKNSFATSLTAGTDKKVTVTSSYGAKDVLKWSSSDKKVVKVKLASTTATSKKVATNRLYAVAAGTATITVKSKNTGKSLKVKVTVKAAETATATPATTPTTVPTATATGGAVTTPSVEPTATATATATATGGATTAPSVEPTATVSGGATTAPSANPSANPSAVPTATGTAVPTVEPVTTPAVTATPSAIEFTAKQTGDKKITITNPTLIKKEDITIKRGNSAVTIDKVDVDETGTTAVITLAGSIVATEYTVAIGEAKVSFTGEASAVADIQITSEEVAMDGKIGEAKKGFANYAVYNQFGENITAKTSLVANTSANSVSLDPTNGIITIDWGKTAAPRLNDLVSVVLMYQNTGKSVSKMLKVATQAAPAEVEVKGVYNRDGKTLSATNVTGDDFYYLFRVKDQYGNYMTSGSVNFTSDSPNMYITTAIGMTNVDVNTQTLQTITVDGVNYLGFPIEKKDKTTSVVAGDITVMLIPGGSGKTVTDTITVAKGNTVTSLTITNPSALPSGGSVDLEYVALDENGDEVTNYRVLKEVKASDDTRFKWVKEDGKVVLRFTDKDEKNNATTPGSAVSCVFQLPNYETRLVTISITDASHTASIAGIDSKVSKATRTGDKVTIPVDKLELQNQFGNSIGKDELVTTSGAAAGGKLGVMVIEEDDNNKVFVATNSAIDKNATKPVVPVYKDQNGTIKKAYILGKNESFYFVGNGEMTGTENVTFKLVQYNGEDEVWEDYETSSYTGAKTNNTQVGAFTTTLHNTVDKKFVSYDVNTIDTIYTKSSPLNADSQVDAAYNNTAYKKNVEVKGVLSNGEKVDLTYGKDFKIVGVKNVTASAVSAGAIEVIDAGKAFAAVENDTVMTVEGKYNVVINYTGDTIEKKVTVSRAAATTAKVAFVDSYTKKGVNIKKDNLKAANVVKYLMEGETAELIIKAEDTYGAGATVNNTGKVTLADINKTEQMIYTISDIDTEKGKVANNGTATPTFAGFEAGDSFKLTYTVGNATFSTIVSVQ